MAEAAGPGAIDHYWAEPLVDFGEVEPLRTAERLEQLRDTFVAANVRTKLSSDIATAMWEKFLFITPWGSLGAVTRLPVGPIRKDAKLRAPLISSVGIGSADRHSRPVCPQDRRPDLCPRCDLRSTVAAGEQSARPQLTLHSLA